MRIHHMPPTHAGFVQSTPEPGFKLNDHQKELCEQFSQGLTSLATKIGAAKPGEQFAIIDKFYNDWNEKHADDVDYSKALKEGFDKAKNYIEKALNPATETMFANFAAIRFHALAESGYVYNEKNWPDDLGIIPKTP